MNRLVSLLILICLTSFVYAGGPGQGTAVHTLVIDPGHGGMDPGAIGPGGHHEADLALAVSLKFGEMVKEAFPDVKIIYTRTTDKFVSLADRADMANKAKADLFICIHLNSATNHDAYGTSTYVLGLHRTDDNLEIAKRENAVIDLEGDKDQKYEFDPNSPEGHIIMSMKQNAFLDQSILIASNIEDELAVLSKRKSRGVKQAGFWVLYKTAMPSLLAEIGFISNPTEEQYLATSGGQENIATSLFKAFRSYKNQIEGRKDNPVVAVKTPIVEKKTEVLKDTVPQQPKSKPNLPVTAANKPLPQDQSQPKQTEPKQSQIPTINQSQPLADKTEKRAHLDTTTKTTPKEDYTTVTYPHIDKSARANQDTQHIQPRIPTIELSSKKSALTIDSQSIFQARKEEPKPILPKETAKARIDTIKPKAIAVSHVTEHKIDTIKQPLAKSDTVKAEKTTHTIAKVDTVKPEKTTQPVAKIDTLKKVTSSQPVVAKSDTVKSKKVSPSIAKVDTIKAPVIKIKEEPKAAKPVPKETPSATKTEEAQKMYFTVQIMAVKRPPSNYKDLVKEYGMINKEEMVDGVVRYMVGRYTHYADAVKTLQKVKANGYPTAFIVSYVDDVRQDGLQTRDLARKHP